MPPHTTYLCWTEAHDSSFRTTPLSVSVKNCDRVTFGRWHVYRPKLYGFSLSCCKSSRQRFCSLAANLFEKKNESKQKNVSLQVCKFVSTDLDYIYFDSLVLMKMLCTPIIQAKNMGMYLKAVRNLLTLEFIFELKFKPLVKFHTCEKSRRMEFYSWHTYQLSIFFPVFHLES